MITQIEKHNDIYIKRDDLFIFNNVCGGKVRSALALCKNAKGLVSAGSRYSPQIKIISEIAKSMSVPFHAHVPFGCITPELQFAINNGAILFPCKPGFNNAIIGRAKKDSVATEYTYIPFGMDCEEAIEQTSQQVANLPDIKRIVVPIGSGISYLGIARGLKRINSEIELIGIQVGADPSKRFKQYNLDYQHCTVIKTKIPYSEKVNATIEYIELDPIYEAKCISYVQKGDLFWIVGKR